MGCQVCRNFHPQNASMGRVWPGFQRVSKSGIGTNAWDATRAAGMTGTDRWMVPEVGLFEAGGRFELKNIRRW